MIEVAIIRQKATPDWAAAQRQLRRAIAAWIALSMEQQRQVAWRGGHDEGSFVASWFGYYLLTGERAVLDFLRWLSDGFRGWAETHLIHGYYPEGEVHHQPENFIFFLPRLWHADPDPRTAWALADAAHHAGNWVADIPPWYDWGLHRFRSWRLGTREVAACPPHDIERPDHFRIIQMVLCAYRATADDRYVELAADFCRRWAREIVDSDLLPALRPFTEGRPDAYPQAFRDAALASPEQRLELHISAGTVDALLDLFSLTGDESLSRAARKILASALDYLARPYSHPLAAALSRYRVDTGDTSLDGDIAARVPGAESGGAAGMLIARPSGPHPMGIGQRRDQVRWLLAEDGSRWPPDERPSPPALVLAYDVTGDDAFASQAMIMAAERMELAAALRDGRRHGCAGGTASAVASGHGRNAGIGEVTGVLYPLALGARRRFGADDPQVRFYCNGKAGLPESCAALWRDTDAASAFAGDEVPLRRTKASPRSGAAQRAAREMPALQLHNAGDSGVRLSVRMSLPRRFGRARDAAEEITLAPGELGELGLARPAI